MSDPIVSEPERRSYRPLAALAFLVVVAAIDRRRRADRAEERADRHAGGRDRAAGARGERPGRPGLHPDQPVEDLQALQPDGHAADLHRPADRRLGLRRRRRQAGVAHAAGDQAERREHGPHPAGRRRGQALGAEPGRPRRPVAGRRRRHRRPGADRSGQPPAQGPAAEGRALLPLRRRRPRLHRRGRPRLADRRPHARRARRRLRGARRERGGDPSRRTSAGGTRTGCS